MNPVLLAMTGAAADATADNAAISAPAAAAESSGAFSLPKMVMDAVAERLQSAKTSQQHSSTAERQHESDPATMQALMALFLAPPTQAVTSAGLQKQPDGEMLKTRIAAQSGNSSSPLLRQLASAMQQNGKSPSPSAQKSIDLSSLPPKLQSAIALLTQDTPQIQATPEQQAKLAIFSAQNLRSIAPGQPVLSTSQQISAQAKQTDRNGFVRPLVVKKNGSINMSQPAAAAQNLINLAAQTNQPANILNNQTLISAHSAQPVDMSTDELGEKLTALLKDRIQFQLGQQQQVSTIRLDPPSLGKLEIAVQLDAGKLTVHIGANQSDVCRSLQQFSEDLRQHLTAQNFMEVNVQVSSEGQSQQQQQQSGHQQEEVMSALSLNDESQYQQHESVLIKV